MRRRLAFSGLCAVVLLILFLYQNCSQVNIGVLSNTGVQSSSNFSLLKSIREGKISRYIFLVDMSFSMVSGPCPQDVDGNILFKRGESRQTVNGWDPNKLLGNRSITDYQQSAAYDCYVDPQYNLGDYPLPYRNADISYVPGGQIVQNPTIIGSDYQAHRLSVVVQWIDQLRENLDDEQEKAVKILVVPYTSGVARERLFAQIDFEFIFRDLKDQGH